MLVSRWRRNVYNGTKMERVTIVAIALVWAGAASPAEVLDSFRPAAVRTEYGTVSEIQFSTGLVELEAGTLAHHLPQAMKDFRFAEPVWVIGYKTEILDSHGKRPQENYLCHTFFSDQRVDQTEENELKGIYSDAFTP